MLSAIMPSGAYPFSELPLVKRFMRGVFNKRPSLPRYTATWDAGLVLDWFEKLWPSNQLSFKSLTLKTVMLLAMVTGQRVQTLHVLSIEGMCYEGNTVVY